MAVITGNYQ